ncbi:BolA/IbaG family iron-sulfur metabolism protein [Natronospirillum operosum]|uniref:BolA/IbaG family iron-sulfur metabolism protein n=1 Tax=Natronospirillum operosum TaxID=2759953 RepID=A0A4Z0WBJ2_9GAMM|nr:BolA/IbaG family iron-sulfur metabolism protein [Natronospirillum operosum]TGG90763.1 BolA/IbaG family iron-sulfur metabolism protein [Natronospirillum operosum]
MTPEQVKEILQAALPDCTIEVTGGDAKFHVRARGEVFQGKMPVKQQQIVYGHLNEHIRSGAIHAVTMDLGAAD